jgi:hypothetical protein
MAGTILVDELCGIALNSIGYHRIIEAIRVRLDFDGSPSIRRVFEPNDAEGMSFISLIEADPATFQFFEQAAIAAREEAISLGEAFPEWDNLVQKLGSDPRSAAA